MAGRSVGQTFSDRFLAARHSLAGQGLAKSVCKATTEELIGPKKKHLDYLVHCTNEPNVSIPQLANLLIERTQNTNWVVVYKALVTCHHMMCYGNERYTQFLASSNSTFQLSNFLDKSGLQGIVNSKTGYDMSPFIRRYARYLNEKALSYRSVAFDFCKVKRGKEDGALRTMNADKLLKTIPVLQNQLDALLEFDCSANDLTNGIINMCFMLLFKDLIRLFACYNDGIINLLEKYFDMNKKQCKEALEIYKKFLVRMDNVGQFLKVAENVGIDKGDIPDLTKAPSSLLDALEQHYNYLDGKKTTSGSHTSAANNINNNHQKNVKSGVTALNSTSNAFGNVASNARFDSLNGIDETMKLKLLAEEEAAMNQFKSKLTTSPTTSSNNINNPFFNNSSSPATLSSQTTPHQTAGVVDLFATATYLNADHSKKASDDLLQLSNPFVDSFNQQSSIVGGNFTATQQQQQTLAWIVNSNNGYGNIQHSSSITNKPSVLPNGTFVSDNNFVSVFGNTEAPGPSGSFDPLGSVLQPINSNGQPPVGNNAITNITGTSDTNAQHQAANGNSGLLTGDLESSLASLAENLTISDRKQTLKGVQWNSNSKSGSSKPNWTPQPMSATTGIGYKPMNQKIMNNMLVNTSAFCNSNTAPVLGQPIVYPQMATSAMSGIPTPMSPPSLVPFTQMNSLNSFSSIGSLPTNQTNSIIGAQQQQLLFH